MVVLEKPVAKAAPRNPKRRFKQIVKSFVSSTGGGGRACGLTPVVQKDVVQLLFPISKKDDFGPTREDVGSIFSISAFNRSARTSTKGSFSVPLG
jgi:hypothetical protein